MKRLFAGGIALCLLISPLHAADFELKDPLPDKISLYGFTFNGDLDIGYFNATHSVPNSTSLLGSEFDLYKSAQSSRAISSVQYNASSLSQVGVSIEEPIIPGWKAIGTVDTGFVPVNGQLDDACKAIIQNEGKSISQATATGTSSRCGQAINGSLYGGVTNKTWGTLTFGRQSSLNSDSLRLYDPNGLAYGYSLIAVAGTFGGGMGIGEAARLDNAIKYTRSDGPFNFGALYAFGGQDTDIHDYAYNLSAGADWNRFSANAVYTVIKSGVASAPLPTYQGPNNIGGTATDSSGFSLAAKYTFDISGDFFSNLIPSSQVVLSGGYQRVANMNPADPIAVGSTTIGGYVLASVNNTSFTTPRILDTLYGGVRWEFSSRWSIIAAYYHIDNHFYESGKVLTYCATSDHSNCAGYVNQESLRLSYVFNRHYDVYAGFNYSTVAGGQSAGFAKNNDLTFTTGLHIRI